MIKKLIILLVISSASIAYAESDEIIALEQRINELTDKIEQLTHKNDLLQKKLDSFAADAEFRFKALEGGGNAAPASQEPIRKPIGADSFKPGDPKDAKKMFSDAYQLLKNQEYTDAEEALATFIKVFPNSEYTGNAYYWLGESFAMRKKYDKAAVNYIIAFNKFPKSSKADLSMIKLVNALNALGKKKEACSTLAKLKAKKANLSLPLQKLVQKEENKNNCK